MIYPLAGIVLGAILGAFRARQRQGNALDMGQWAAVFAIIGALLGLAVMIAVQRAYTG